MTLCTLFSYIYVTGRYFIMFLPNYENHIVKLTISGSSEHIQRLAFFASTFSRIRLPEVNFANISRAAFCQFLLSQKIFTQAEEYLKTVANTF